MNLHLNPCNNYSAGCCIATFVTRLLIMLNKVTFYFWSPLILGPILVKVLPIMFDSATASIFIQGVGMGPQDLNLAWMIVFSHKHRYIYIYTVVPLI